MQSLLSAVLVILIILLLLIFFVPAWLERQSRANCKQRQTFADDVQAQEIFVQVSKCWVIIFHSDQALGSVK